MTPTVTTMTQHWHGWIVTWRVTWDGTWLPSFERR
jgi:hypothetical protein